jgi:hypothetical protein
MLLSILYLVRSCCSFDNKATFKFLLEIANYFMTIRSFAGLRMTKENYAYSTVICLCHVELVKHLSFT